MEMFWWLAAAKVSCCYSMFGHFRQPYTPQKAPVGGIQKVLINLRHATCEVMRYYQPQAVQTEPDVVPCTQTFVVEYILREMSVSVSQFP